MANSLTRTAGLKLGSVFFETLLKHYFDRVKREGAKDGIPITQLRQDELLYDEAFNIVKKFLDAATRHTVEELQAFSNSRTPSPPWVHTVRVIVPISCCDEAAALVIQALGGEEQATRLVGGTKWWQVRGVNGVAGEWVTARKDWQEAEKRRKIFEQKKGANHNLSPPQNEADGLPSNSEPNNAYDEGMDEMRCVLFSHGGGYYFGSIDQERYCFQRYARKIKGRVFAISYRLAPQYPFPCALQDLVAAYLYLIRPPPDAPHQPVNPAHIVVAGDSAGGGLTLALLQLLRDTGLPLPAGGVLISPWCDLTHSFPSIHTNTATDVLPLYGLSLHKPSALWPPPSEEMTHKVHTGLRRRIRELVRVTVKGSDPRETASQLNLTRDALAGSRLSLSGDDGKSVSSDMPIDVGATVSLPSVDEKEHQTISLETKSGECLKIDSQIQLYTQNSLLGHPLVSPALSYLGGLPPLLVIASDKEVLRDEIIYSAHKAADPSRFPLKDEARALYPPLVGIEERYGPTQVHLQVYDDTAHVMPILFPFTTPGKYCYRAIATFTKHVTGMLNSVKSTYSSDTITSPSNSLSNNYLTTPQIPRSASAIDLVNPAQDDPKISSNVTLSPGSITESPRARTLSSFTRPVLYFRMKSMQGSMTRSSSEKTLAQGRSSASHSQGGQNVGGPGRLRRSVSMPNTRRDRYAGEHSVYYDEQGQPSWKGDMIRERISTQGIIRPLEPAEQLDAMHVPPAIIGVLSERALRRYLEGKTWFDKKYTKEMVAVEKERNRNIDLAKKDITKSLSFLEDLQNGKVKGRAKGTTQEFKDGLESSIATWGWALADERPPPSSIVSRRDTREARTLARIADLSVLQDEIHMSGNNLWAVVMNFLSTSPAKEEKEEAVSDSEATTPAPKAKEIRKSKSVFASLRHRARATEEPK